MGVFVNGLAQTTYKMANAKVYACKGKLTDSEGNKQSPKKYANNENLICEYLGEFFFWLGE
jgi:hypothetical protein